jgi:hypothetical protein
MGEAEKGKREKITIDGVTMTMEKLRNIYWDFAMFYTEICCCALSLKRTVIGVYKDFFFPVAYNKKGKEKIGLEIPRIKNKFWESFLEENKDFTKEITQGNHYYYYKTKNYSSKDTWYE